MIGHATQLKTENGVTYAKTVFQDDAALSRIKALRDEKVLDKAQLALHDNADLRLVVSCPSLVMWNFFKRDHAATYKLLHSDNEHERMKGAKQVEFLHPEWCIYSRL